MMERKPTAAGFHDAYRAQDDGETIGSPTGAAIPVAVRGGVREVVDGSQPVGAVAAEVKPHRTLLGIAPEIVSPVPVGPVPDGSTQVIVSETEFGVSRNYARDVCAMLRQAGLDELRAYWIAGGKATPVQHREAICQCLTLGGVDPDTVTYFRNNGCLDTSRMPFITSLAIEETSASSPLGEKNLEGKPEEFCTPQQVAPFVAASQNIAHAAQFVATNFGESTTDLSTIPGTGSSRALVAVILAGLLLVAVGGTCAVRKMVVGDHAVVPSQQRR